MNDTKLELMGAAVLMLFSLAGAALLAFGVYRLTLDTAARITEVLQ